MKTVLALIISATAFVSADCWGEQTAAQLCAMDLEVIPGFLLENDAGAKVHLEQFGQKHFDDAFAKAKEATIGVPDASACDDVLRQYLKTWRKGHLHIQSLYPAPAAAGPSGISAPVAKISNAKEPQLRTLSRQTMLLTLSSFANQYRAPLIGLLSRHRKELANHRDWIIDVRGNGGGSDSSYEPLLPWLLSDETATAGAEWLSTPANIRGQEQLCARIAPGDTLCEKEAKAAVTRMRSIEPGQYISQDDAGVVQFERIKQGERQRPSRVAILVDDRCASSCEELLLIARQSFSVKLVGQSTFGSLDYSNLRPYDLPSGQRVLWYATSRSMRLPNYPVDLGGIPPDVYLPARSEDPDPEGEVERVKRWLEGGSLVPAKTESVQR
jgi:hypothetical protein